MNYTKMYRKEKYRSSLGRFGRKVSDVYEIVCWEMRRSELPKALVLIVAFVLVASVQSLLAGILVFTLAYLLYKAL